jgi:hypothetical protein
MKIPFPVRVALVFTVAFLTLGKGGASAEPPYIGEWSSGKGETLIITAETVQYGFKNDHKPIPYRDITKATDAKGPFQLLILVKGDTYYFQKYAWLTLTGSDEMKMERADSIEKYTKGDVSFQNWFRDK